MKRYFLFFLSIAAFPAALIAQSQNDFEDVLTGNVNDAKYLTEGYISPFMKAFGYGMNNGWYTSAAPHKLGGFELTLTAAVAYAPVADKTYFVDNSKMTSIERMSGSTVTAVPESGTVPTVFGSEVAPNYRSPQGGPPTSKFTGPAGLGINFLPTPALSLGVGLPKGFELKVRFVPTIDLSKNFDEFTGTFGMFGIGVMHDIKQWIPGVKNLPFDISAFVGYTKLKLDLGFDAADASKHGDFACSATTIQALVGKKISVLSVYGSLGYNIAKTDLGLKGNYDFNDNGTIEANERDPFTITTASNGVRGTIGLRIRLAVIAFHADYTMQKYRTITGGFGINFR